MGKIICFTVSDKTFERLKTAREFRSYTWKQYFIHCAIRNERKIMELSPHRECVCGRNIQQFQKEFN